MDEFLGGCERKFQKRFYGAFDQITQMGAKYVNGERFKPLKDPGKPLWEFKEHDHRIYCHRICEGDQVKIILLNGCVKQKEGRSKTEDADIARAKQYYEEYLTEEKAQR